jgi:SAM-dependent methyltransferase
MSQTGGYIADVAYTAGFYPETAPAHMAFAALCRRRSPGLAWRPRRLLELGFGQGFGLALLAAANPDIAFEGCDFNAEHVAHARGLIADAQLENIVVTKASFEEIAAHGGDSDVDVAILHGIVSWIDRAGQEAVREILRRRLRPDGIAYVSYNCMPGWAALAPIRHLMLEVKRRNPGGSEQQLGLGLDLLARLWQANAGYLAINPIAAHHVGAMLAMDRHYLAHEYLVEHADASQFSTVAELLAPADLSYAASADVLDSFDQYAVPQATLPVIGQIADPILRETVRDFAANRRFRRDLFARGVTELSPAAQHGLLSRLSFAPAAPRSRMIFKFLGPASELNLKPEFHGAVADLLATRNAGFDELLALPAFGDNGTDRLLDCLALLVYSGQVRVLVESERVDAAPAQRFNRLIVERARGGRFYEHLASPVARSGLPVSEAGLLALAVHFDGRDDDPATAAHHALSILKALGRRPLRDNKHVSDDDEAIALLRDRMQPIFEELFPLWRRLGVM